MRKNMIRLCALIFVLSLALSVPALAVTITASDQIHSYDMDVLAIGNGKLAIEFSIEGTGWMDRIGAKSIVIYEKFGNNWLIVASYDKDDPGMSTKNINMYGNTIYYSGYSGTQYRVQITVFAENASGSDSRFGELYITA